MPKKKPRPTRGRPLGAPDLTTARGQVGAAIRRARLAAGLEVEAVAETVGVSAKNWYNWEGGRAFPPLDRLSAIADAIGCRIDDLISEGE